MYKAITYGLITSFWLVMGFLLYQSEFGPRKAIGASIQPALVWDKILTAPDSSALEIRVGTNRIGYCRWRPDLGQELATGARMSETEPVEGMIRHLAYYTLDVDGNMTLPNFSQRLRFVFGLKLDTNRVWQELNARVTVRPDIYELSASSTGQTVRLHVDAGGDSFTRTIRFSDFRNPQKLLTELGGPTLPLMLGALGFAAGTNSFDTSGVVHWEAHKSTLMLGRNAIPAYRLKASLLDRYEATFYVSPVGEILRIELPHRIVLMNDAVMALQRPK